MNAAYLYKVGQFLSLVALLCLPVKSMADEFDDSRTKNWKELDESINGKPAPNEREVAPPVVETPPAKPIVIVVPVVVPVETHDSAPVAPPVAAPIAASASPKTNGHTFRDCPDCAEMVVIPAGRFEMGAPDNANEIPVATFAMGRTEVTQGQWKALMHRNPSKNAKCGDDCPVDSVSWEEAQSFIEMLNEKTGKNYRLASRAEWEYACRAGGKHRYCGATDAYAIAWHKGNSGGETHIVATQKPNAFGLYDMNGNVDEWTADGKDKYYMVRGGSYRDDLDLLYPHLRNEMHINTKEAYVGFRLVRSLP